jgi:succinate-acetate transporter protein
MSRNTADANSRMTYDRFVEFERLMGVYPSGARQSYNAAPIGFCAFALTLFVYSMYLAGATVPITTSAAIAMGLALFYGGLIQLIAGLYELRLGNNFNALLFCSYAGFWFGLGSLYVSGSFAFTEAITDSTALNNAFGVFFLGWTIFTLFMLISSARTNAALVIFFFFLLITYVLLTASYFLNLHLNLLRASGAIGIFTAVIGWYLGFASLLIKGENHYVSLPLYDISRRSFANPRSQQAVELRAQT